MSDAADLLDLLDAVIAQARPSEAVEAFGVDGTETSVKAYHREVETLVSARSRGVGVRVIADGRLGYASTSDLSHEALAATLDAARRNASAADPDDANVLPDPPSAGLPSIDGLYDAAFEAVSADRKVTAAIDLEGAVLAAGGDVKGVDSARYGDEVLTQAIASTAGLRGSYRRCDAFAMVEVLAARDGSTTSAYGIRLARTLDELDVAAAAAEGIERAVRLLGGAKPATAKVPIVFDPFATAAFLGVLSEALSADAVQKGRSLFAGKVGEQVGSDGIELVDDGRLVDGPSTAPWDAEGVPTQRTSLLAGGELRGWLHNRYTAAKEGAASTGNARRGYRRPPGVGPTNLFLTPGTEAPEALLAAVGEGFYCQQLLGVHSGANAVSGDFSVGAAGLMIRGGQLAEPVREAVVAGTIPAMLQGIAAVGADLRFPFGGGVGGQTIVIEGMTLAGA